MNLFILNKNTFDVDISPEAALLQPFSKIIKRDRSKLKKKAKAELAFVYFMIDYKSDFQSILDEEDRQVQIITILDGIPDDWRPDKVVKDAMVFYKERSETIASMALEYQRNNIKTLLEKIQTFIKSNDANEVQKASNMSSKVNTFIEDLNKLEKIVKGEQEADSRHRGTQKKSLMEDLD